MTGEKGCYDPSEVFVSFADVGRESPRLQGVKYICIHDIDGTYRRVELDDIRKAFSAPKTCNTVPEKPAEPATSCSINYVQFIAEYNQMVTDIEKKDQYISALHKDIVSYQKVIDERDRTITQLKEENHILLGRDVPQREYNRALQTEIVAITDTCKKLKDNIDLLRGYNNDLKKGIDTRDLKIRAQAAIILRDIRGIKESGTCETCKHKPSIGGCWPSQCFNCNYPRYHLWEPKGGNKE